MFLENVSVFKIYCMCYFLNVFFVVINTGHVLQGKVFVKLQLNCQSPIEFSYYSSGIKGKLDLCCYCKAEGVQQDEELKKQFRVVLPVCQTCLDNHKPILKRNPIKK